MEINLDWLIRFLLSTIFVLSAVGKLFDYTASSLNINLSFGGSHPIAKIAVTFWSILEIGLAALIWLHHLTRKFLAVPLALLGITTFSYWRGIDCGCFGSLPYFSQFSFGGHLLLLGGMFLGLYYLTASPKIVKMNGEDGQSSRIFYWAGVAAIVMMLSAFLTLPFTSSDSQAQISAQNDIVDRATVETAIANHSAVIIDARPGYQYEFGHIPTAINIPYDSDSLAVLVEKHSLKNHALITYCSSAHCNAAELLAEKLRTLGCQKIQIYAGGWEEWVAQSSHREN